MSEKIFGREDFLKLQKPVVKKVFCESLNAHVYMKKMSALDFDNYNNQIIEFVEDENGNTKLRQNLKGVKLKFLVYVLCDEHGNRLFKDDEYIKLGALDREVVDELFQKASELNEISEAEKEKLEKNSSTEQEEGLPLG